MKQRLHLVLSILLILTLLPIEAFANSQNSAQNLKNLEIKWLEADELDVSWGYNEEPKFENGYATFKLNDKYGLVDRKGNVVIPAKYKRIKTHNEGLAVGQFNGKLYLINKKGQEFDLSAYDDVGTISEGILSVKKDNKWGYFDEKGREIVAPKYMTVNEFKEGFGRAAMENYTAYTFVDKNGKEITNEAYPHARDFKDGMARVSKLNSENLLVDCFIDKTGKEVIPAQYSKVLEFNNGLAIVGGNPEGSYLKYGFIDKTGKVVVPIKYAEVMPFTGGFARVSLKEASFSNQKWGYIDENGKEILIDQYDQIGEFVDGIAWFRLRDQYGFVDKNGELVPAKYDKAYDFKNGFARVQLGNKYGFIDKTGKEIASPKYGEAEDFYDGLAAVQAAETRWENGLGYTDTWFLNEKGQEQIKDYANYNKRFSDGLLKIQFMDRLLVHHLFYLDKNGNKVIDLTGSFISGSNFVDGYALLKARVNGKTKYAFLKKPNLGNTQPKVNTIQAKYSTVNLKIDGTVAKGMEIYNIAENNYFKLRDVAKLLESTEKRFSVDWNNEKKSISLQLGQAYQSQGNELSGGDKKDKSATLSDAKLELNGKEVKLSAYTIANNNYFKLRDLCDSLGVKVEWDQGTSTILLKTK